MNKKKTDWLKELVFGLSAGRRNKSKPFFFGKEQRSLIGRTVTRAPEVMVKISGGGKSLKQVYSHMTYLVRNGKLEAITENGDKVSSRAELRELADEWDLPSTRGFGRVKVAYNLVLSMPKNTDAKRLNQAVKEFARDQFWDKHQYIMVLHEDKDHPHVHICVKAMEKDGKTRLYIRKNTLAAWRQAFAEVLRDNGIEANATPRMWRGATRRAKRIALYHAEKAGRSTVLEAKVKEIAAAIQKEENGKGAWDMALANRRASLTQIYERAADELQQAGDPELAQAVKKFAASLPPIETERDWLRAELIRRVNEKRARRNAQKTNTHAHQKKVAHAAHSTHQSLVKQQPVPKRDEGEREQERDDRNE